MTLNDMTVKMARLVIQSQDWESSPRSSSRDVYIAPSDQDRPTPCRRAYLSPEAFKSLSFKAGDWVVLAGNTPLAVVQLWPRAEVKAGSILVSPLVSAVVGMDEVDVSRFEPTRSAGAARTITVELFQTASSSSSPARLTVAADREAEWYKEAVKQTLMSMRYTRKEARYDLGNGEGLAFTVHVIDRQLRQRKQKAAAELVAGMSKLQVSGPSDSADQNIFEVDGLTQVVFPDTSANGNASSSSNAAGPSSKATPTGALPSYINLFTPADQSSSSYDLIGGLEPQIKQVRSLLDLPLQNPGLFTLFGLTPPRGVLLHGPPGTGKTALARAVASSTPGCSCIVVNGPELSSAYHGESEERLRGVFAEARKRSPCIIVLDEVDTLCPRRDGDGGEVERRVVATLLTLMDGMATAGAEADRVFVIAATNRPNSIDPALRRPGRFDREIEIGIPDAAGRQHILEILLGKMPNSLSSADVTGLAARTHGYVGADLTSLVRESAIVAIQAWSLQTPESRTPQPTLTNADVLATLPTVRPSAMREVFVETPEVRWSDIGGQDDVKQKLRECVEWPLTHRDTFKRLGVEAPRGVLLYGPPGCSKTMTAKALATESGINFIAVKGPELLNKYVGESEKAVREIFRKARAASPSIVFFDEIDALGSARSDDTSHNGVLTSLLNEMDGIEELSGVTVVAATNRPDVLDSALMRPGRLDRILYVGAPDLPTRRDIFRIRMASMAVEPGVDVDQLAQITEGCSGAEVASICQDAALAAMNEDLDAPYVKGAHLLHSARTVRRRITPSMLRFFNEWRDQSGVRSA